MCEESKNVILEIAGDAKPEACKVKIEKNSKGYNFELSMSGPDFPTRIKAIEEANEVMKIKFGSA